MIKMKKNQNNENYENLNEEESLKWKEEIEQKIKDENYNDGKQYSLRVISKINKRKIVINNVLKKFLFKWNRRRKH